jgi:hypothetical protein
MREMIPDKSEPVDLTSGDHTFTLRVDAIFCSADGTVVARLRKDTADTEWAVKAGDYLLGNFRLVRDTSSPSTGLIGVADTSKDS